MRLQHRSLAKESFPSLRFRNVAAPTGIFNRRRSTLSALSADGKASELASSQRLGFTLIELLVVIAILGMVAAIGLPLLKGMGKSTAVTTATRQLLDDLAVARQRAISGRTDVYLVFVPPYSQWTGFNWNSVAPGDRRVASNLLGGQYTGYALFAARQVGDQPGRSNSRYLTTWRTLPQGTFIAANKFWAVTDTIKKDGVPITVLPFAKTNIFKFPTTSGLSPELPFIGFDYQGHLIPRTGFSPRDEFITLARGSVMPVHDANGQLQPADADVQENPPGNSTNIFNVIGIDWLTGRARVERRQLQ